MYLIDICIEKIDIVIIVVLWKYNCSKVLIIFL